MRHESKDNREGDIKSLTNVLFVASGVGITLLGLILLMSRQSYSQFVARPDVKIEASYVKKQFKLTTKEFEKIRPFLNEEIKNLVKLYTRYTDDEPEYSLRVWRDFIQRRIEFENGLAVNLSTSQKAAIRSSRSRTERQVVSALIKEYVRYVGEFLELEDWEFNDIYDVLETDSKLKLRTITDNLKRPSLQSEMVRISRNTEAELKKILSGERWDGYLKLTESRQLIA